MPEPRQRLLFTDEIVGFEKDLIHLHDGSVRAVVATSSLNFNAMAPEQQARTIRAYRDLLHADSGPLQIYVRVQRLRPDRAAPDDEPEPTEFGNRREYLAALTASFIGTHLAEMPVFSREVFIVLASRPNARTRLRTIVYRFSRRASDEPRVALEQGAPLEHRIEILIEQLRLMGIRGRRMRSAELRTLFDGLYGRRAEQGGDRRITFQHRVGSLELEGRWYASLVVERYPGEEVAAGWLLPFLGFKGELHLAIHVVPLATDRTLDFLSRKIRDLRADQIVSSEAASVEANAFTTLPDAVEMHQSLARNEEKSFALALYLTVGADSPAALRQQLTALQACCRRMMLRVGQPYFQMRQALLASWPLACDELRREQLVHTGAVASLLPWLQEDLADGAGHYWGHNRETGGLVVFDPFDETRFPNANIAVLAHSGAGKSYAAATLILSGHTRGVGAILLDPEAEYGGLVEGLGGTYLSLAAGSGHAINALDLVRERDQESPFDQLSDIIDLIALMCGGLDAVERAQVEMAIRAIVFSPDRVAVLADVWSALRLAHPASRAAAVLERWVTGDLGRLFSAPTNVDLSAEVVGFNLRDLKEEVVPPASLLLASWLWSVLRRDRRPRHLLIDEAGLLLEQEPIRRFLVRLARRIRKYQGSLILVSQNPGDFFETKDGAVLATNPSILLLGSQKHSEALKLQRAFNLTERQVAYLETAERGDFLLLAGSNRVPVHVMAPPWMDELIVRSHRR